MPFGRSWRAFSRENVLYKQLTGQGLNEQVRQLVEDQEPELEALAAGGPDLYRRLPHLLWASSRATVTTAHRVDVLQDASEKYPRLLEDLRNAKRHIHLVYYEWASDPFTEEIAHILAERARAGAHRLRPASRTHEVVARSVVAVDEHRLEQFRHRQGAEPVVASRPASQASRAGSAAPAASAASRAGSMTRNTWPKSETVLMP